MAREITHVCSGTYSVAQIALVIFIAIRKGSLWKKNWLYWLPDKASRELCTETEMPWSRNNLNCGLEDE
jgi:hypothetical protein